MSSTIDVDSVKQLEEKYKQWGLHLMQLFPDLRKTALMFFDYNDSNIADKSHHKIVIMRWEGVSSDQFTALEKKIMDSDIRSYLDIPLEFVNKQISI